MRLSPWVFRKVIAIELILPGGRRRGVWARALVMAEEMRFGWWCSCRYDVRDGPR